MVQHLALDDHGAQVVVYDQGIRTDDRRWQEIEEYANTVADRSALEVLRAPALRPCMGAVSADAAQARRDRTIPVG